MGGRVGGGEYTPALGFHLLTPLYDAAVSWTCREHVWRPLLIQVVGRESFSLVDVGCGTGTLLSMLAVRYPLATLYGVDPDRAALRLAAEKLVCVGPRSRIP